MKNKLILILRGGLGNQLFTYAAAIQLAKKNNAEIFVDTKLGFYADNFNRKYELDNLKNPPKSLSYNEKFTGLIFLAYKVIRFIMPYCNLLRKKIYIDYKINGSNRLCNLEFKGTFLMDGYFHGEQNFRNIATIIKDKFKFKSAQNLISTELLRKINEGTTIAVHFRRFNLRNKYKYNNLNKEYYLRAVEILENKLYKPVYYIFSDYKLNSNLEEIFPNNRYFIIDTNNKDKSAFIDLWLMTQMQNHIIANSTFSWWGAWLSDYDNKIIISPNINIKNNEGYWNPNIYNNNEWISI